MTATPSGPLTKEERQMDEKKSVNIEEKIKEMKKAPEPHKELPQGNTQKKVSDIYDPRRAKERRRHPKKHAFLTGMIIYFSIMLLIIGTAVCIGWRYAPLISNSSPDKYVESLTATTTPEGWRQQLRIHLPKNYAPYEDASNLAYEVLSPALNLGNITYIRYAGRLGAPIYELFSDGEAFARLTLKDVSEGALSLPVWEIGNIEFHISYFKDVKFRDISVTVPEGAILTVNGVENVIGSTVTAAKYPEISPAEAGADVAPCVKHSFDDLYYLPEISATLNGVALQRVDVNENEFYFKYPASSVHTLTVTAPEGMTVLVGGVAVNESWAAKSQTEGELGELDDGGSGTLPMLNVWSIDGIFASPEVRGEVYGKDVPLKSQNGSDFVFTIPAECKYTITLILPAGAQATVNGVALDPASKLDGGATAEELGMGMTYLGRYEVTELSAVPSAVPAFDKYKITGYLALPKITAKLGDTELPEAGVKVSEYDVLWEFDYPAGDTPDADRTKAAENFAKEYIEYICDGGAWENPDNYKDFNENYESLLTSMVKGTAGYIGIMQSYGTVYKMPRSLSYTIDGITVSDAISYTEESLSLQISYTVTRTVKDGESELTQTLEGSIMVLQVLYENEWRVWSFFLEGGIADLS